ncbi:MAG TPA: T9SS type A sorting domain-containing protein [Bacteroidota bacterium]|nr:T9SS type A sorting domain-containing protein [Bacteroidota bacterium]
MILKVSCLIVVLTLLSSPYVFSQTYIPPPRGSSQYLYDSLHYDFYITSPIDSTKKYPLILYFHGYNDTAQNIFNWYYDSIQSVNPCFLLEPKCPPNDQQGWGNTFLHVFSPRLNLTFKLLDSLLRCYPIDTNRLYVYGKSMGGFGVIEALFKFPTKFAAAMVMCGGGDPSVAPEIMRTPVWFFHGEIDNVVPISQSLNLYNEMVLLGAKHVRYSAYPFVGHNVWPYAEAEPSWSDWIFHFSKTDTSFTQKPDTPVITFCQEAMTDVHYPQIVLKWNNAYNRLIRKNKIWYYKIIRNDTLLASVAFTKSSYSDDSLDKGINAYKIVAVNYDFIESDTSITASINNTLGIHGNGNLSPQMFVLSQNYPNPFNPSTTITFSLPYRTFVTLKVFDLLGRELSTIAQEELSAGTYSRVWQANNIASGIYFYRLQADGFSETKKLILLR